MGGAEGRSALSAFGLTRRQESGRPHGAIDAHSPRGGPTCLPSGGCRIVAEWPGPGFLSRCRVSTDAAFPSVRPDA